MTVSDAVRRRWPFSAAAAGTVVFSMAVTWAPLPAKLTVVAVLLLLLLLLLQAPLRGTPQAGLRVVSIAGAPAPTWDRVTVVVALALPVVASDLIVLGPSWLPYTIPVLIVAVALSKPRSGRAFACDLVLAPLVLWGLIGSIYGRLLLAQGGNALPFFVPMLIALLHWWLPLKIDKPREARRLTRVIMYASTLYVVLSYAVLVLGWRALPSADFNHTRVYFVTMALVAAWLLGKWLLLTGLVALSIPSFFAYPALTFVLVLALAAVVLVAIYGRLLVLILGALAGCILVIFTATRIADVRIAYFQSVHKIDNTSTRDVLLKIGLAKFDRSPLIGDLFTADIAVPSKVTGTARLVPVHNDYLQLTISGGLAGGVLFAAWAACAVWVAIRLVRRLQAAGLQAHSELGAVVTVGLTGMLITAAFNPILVDIRNSLILALLYTIIMSLRMVAGTTATAVAPG